MSYVTKDTKNTKNTTNTTNINKYDYSDILKKSFYITYVLLLTTGTITFIEAIRTNNDQFRHILNLETCISVIAGYFYSVFLIKVENYKDNTFNWEEISKIRYIDWLITTPVMLLVLCLVLGMDKNNKNNGINIFKYLVIIALNFTMLMFGYLGEIGKISRLVSFIFGFIPFFIMFYYIYKNFIDVPKHNSMNNWLFTFYIIIWSIYGFVFLLPEQLKNIMTNVLDLISKCFVGIGIWAYYTHVIKL